MGRYRKIDVRIWNDAKFMALSDTAKLVFLFGLTHPHMTMLGAMRATIPGLAAERGMSAVAFGEAFQEVLSKGMAKHDEKACFVWFPNFLKYNKPESPNVVKAWPEAFEMLPECEMKVQLFEHLKNFAAGLTEGFQEAFQIAVAKAMPNQEQEQEQEFIYPPAAPTPERRSPPKSKRSDKTKVPAAVLEEIYDAYPRHVGRNAALKAIEKAICRTAPSQDSAWLLERTRAYARQRKGEDEKFTPHPKTWFNEGRYYDESLEGSATEKSIWVDADGNQLGGSAAA
jgi:hypothetical protein